MGTLSSVNTMGTSGSCPASPPQEFTAIAELLDDPVVPIVFTNDKVPMVPSVINNDMVEVHFNIKKRSS